MPRLSLEDALKLLCDKYDLPGALLVVPDRSLGYIIIANNVSSDSLRDLGKLILQVMPDKDSQLN